ncbi:hypothetical protein HMPREF2874_00645 [Rothia sp. HMSC068F09]|nr:hypothetical protein HMPREF2874_00645 [Rothia sp. HMSC068F09]
MPPEIEKLFELIKHTADAASDTHELFEIAKWILLIFLPFLNRLWKALLSLLNRLWGTFYIRWVILPELAPRSFPKTIFAYRLMYRATTWLSISYTVYSLVSTISLLVSLLF